ncbi:hypothetical protein B1T45_07540 [Mycobacterium kansasii]|nr:hypothetical protein B1T43_07465 [Mycobacterium kansasii]ARG61174.1 hypothetical protein B1T45_07540 [Mycobacterium kansasii]ARG68879.1 hypothetical protein B1T47_07305 [Mycobacterium kansasii]ARG76489.1 hypothetical protein B1T51_20720 [Mycobacterium kansasii]ARG82023.1 hypothetical protein B1T52_21160 [Mycobacterium kansasii]
MRRAGYRGRVGDRVRHWTPTAGPSCPLLTRYGGSMMAKRGRKKRDRKHSKANHGKRPNS